MGIDLFCVYPQVSYVDGGVEDQEESGNLAFLNAYTVKGGSIEWLLLHYAPLPSSFLLTSSDWDDRRRSDFSICGRIVRCCHSSETCSWSFALHYSFCWINKKEMCMFLAIFTLTTVKSEIAGRAMIAWNAGEVHPRSVGDSFEIHSSPLTVNSCWGHLAITDTLMIRVGAKSRREKVRITGFWNEVNWLYVSLRSKGKGKKMWARDPARGRAPSSRPPHASLAPKILSFPFPCHPG